MPMEDLEQLSQDYYTLEKAISYLDTHFRGHPSLEKIALHVHVRPYHFHRLFKRWAGITPDRFQKYLTLEFTKQRLAEGSSILETAYEAGLSSPGRLHDLFITFEAVTPGQFKGGSSLDHPIRFSSDSLRCVPYRAYRTGNLQPFIS